MAVKTNIVPTTPQLKETCVVKTKITIFFLPNKGNPALFYIPFLLGLSDLANKNTRHLEFQIKHTIFYYEQVSYNI